MSLAVRATSVTVGVVNVMLSVMVSETVNNPKRHNDRPDVAALPAANVRVVAVNEYGAVKNTSIRPPLVAPALPILP
jgi:hypothetical protein